MCHQASFVFEVDSLRPRQSMQTTTQPSTRLDGCRSQHQTRTKNKRSRLEQIILSTQVLAIQMFFISSRCIPTCSSSPFRFKISTTATHTPMLPAVAALSSTVRNFPCVASSSLLTWKSHHPAVIWWSQTQKGSCHAALERECAVDTYPGCQEHNRSKVGLPTTNVWHVSLPPREDPTRGTRDDDSRHVGYWFSRHLFASNHTSQQHDNPGHCANERLPERLRSVDSTEI